MHAGLTSLLPPDDRFASSVIRDLLAQARRPDVHSLAGGLPAAELLPTERLGAGQTAGGSGRGVRVSMKR